MKNKNEKTKSDYLGILRIPRSLRPPMFHKSKKGKGSYDRKKSKSINFD